MSPKNPQYIQDIESVLNNLSEVGAFEEDTTEDVGMTYRVYAADADSVTDAMSAVEHEPIPNGHPIQISSGDDNWFWLSVQPNSEI